LQELELELYKTRFHMDADTLEKMPFRYLKTLFISWWDELKQDIITLKQVAKWALTRAHLQAIEIPLNLELEHNGNLDEIEDNWTINHVNPLNHELRADSPAMNEL
jgi:hypothetical protein